jgi:hypothetical protein
MKDSTCLLNKMLSNDEIVVAKATVAKDLQLAPSRLAVSFCNRATSNQAEEIFLFQLGRAAAGGAFIPVQHAAARAREREDGGPMPRPFVVTSLCRRRKLQASRVSAARRAVSARAVLSLHSSWPPLQLPADI